MNKENKKNLRFSIPMRTIFDFQGEGMYEETLEDHFRLIICDELLRKNIKFDFNYHTFEVKDGFGTELQYEGTDIDLRNVIQNLIQNKFRLGLVVQKFENGYWTEKYNDSQRMKYKEFDIINE
ncbi:hypothetical protein [Tenacibaculum sp. M341]|uniref:hypothetical protein n=1 Tax=Tenacibaculum sp. M341 TaxID=2530339 RepID=UPI00104327ED|nr:hypothetical protein [Tenacibaculum sp. M341]TCI90613.1 hypothetical protein EYW44_12865 [Tenacibaculum sp. M341]